MPVHGGLPSHMTEATKTTMAAIPALAAVLAGGAAWGMAMARIIGMGNSKRMAWVGALGYGPTIIIVAIVLTWLEVVILERDQGPDWPVHLVFTLLFVPAAFIIAGVGGLAYQDWALAGRLALSSGVAAGSAFLLVNLVMDALGWRVGGPGAVERMTMLTVMFAGNLVAALAGGATIGLMLNRRQAASTPALQEAIK